MAKCTLFALAALSLTIACGSGSSDDSDAAVDSGPTIDAPPLGCGNNSIAEQLGTIDGASFSAIADNRGVPNGPIVMRITAIFDQSPPPNSKDDIISIRLFEGFTVFDPNFMLGTYPLSGPETNFYTCGACVHVLGDYDPGEQEVAQNFFADSGTLTLTEISTMAGQVVTGTINNAHFRQVTLDDQGMTQLVVPGGCEATVDEIAFTAPVQVL